MYYIQQIKSIHQLMEKNIIIKMKSNLEKLLVNQK